MPTARPDVIVVGGGNAAFCAALAAQEQGASVVMLEAAPEEEAGGNSRFTAGSMRVVYNGVEDIKALGARSHRAGDRDHRFRHLYGGPVLRRHGAGDPVPRRSRSCRASGHAELRDLLLDAREGHPLHSDLWPPGIQDRGQVQVLGRAHGRSRRRRARSHQDADRGRNASAASRSAIRRARSSSRPTACASKACASVTTAWKATCTASRWCLPAAGLKPMRNGARAISARAGISPRCAAPASTPAMASAWRWTSARAPAATGRAAMPCNGK